MKKIIIASLAILSIAICCLSSSPSKADETNYNIENGGCCSHHGGECQCIGNHVVCCDGWQGSSCGC